MAATQFTSVENALYLARELQERGYPQPVFTENLDRYIACNKKRFYVYIISDNMWDGVRYLNQMYIDSHSHIKTKNKYSNDLFKSQILFPGTKNPDLKEQQRRSRDPDAPWDDNSTGGWRNRDAKRAMAEFLERDGTFNLGTRNTFNGKSRAIPGEINKKLINFQDNHLKHNSAQAKIYTRNSITNDEIQARRRKRANQYQKGSN